MKLVIILIIVGFSSAFILAGCGGGGGGGGAVIPTTTGWSSGTTSSSSGGTTSSSSSGGSTSSSSGGSTSSSGSSGSSSGGSPSNVIPNITLSLNPTAIQKGNQIIATTTINSGYPTPTLQVKMYYINKDVYGNIVSETQEGSTGTATTVSYIPNNTGDYKIVSTATNSSGSSTDTKTFEVTIGLPPGSASPKY